jgi:Flp pilus assembly protein TadG
MMIRRGQNRKRRRGAAVVEFAFSISIVLLMLFASVEYGRYVMYVQIVENAAREAARDASVGTANKTTAQIQAVALHYLAQQPLENVTVQVYEANPNTGASIGAWTTAEFGESIAVQVQGYYRPMLPTLGLIPNPVRVTGRAMMRSEAN